MYTVGLRRAVLCALIAGAAAIRPAADGVIPARLGGPDLTTLTGWLAGVYPSWPYVPAESTVHPINEIWSPLEPQSFGQVQYAARQLSDYGSAADVVQYNPHPESPDHNVLLRSYYGGHARPFFLLYEHLHGTRFRLTVTVGPEGLEAPVVDMSDPYNRAIFLDDLATMFRDVIVPNQHRYVTLDGRAVIYMWATAALRGDIGGLLEAAKAQYPVAFLGSEDIDPPARDQSVVGRIAALDGFMPYAVLDPDNEGDYLRMVVSYRLKTAAFRRYLNRIDAGKARRRLLIPTFQMAFDNSQLPGSRRPDGTLKVTPMYPRSFEELLLNAQIIRNGSTVGHIWDRVGPFVIYSEFFEGAAVAQSVEGPELPDRYVGYGTARMRVMQQFFSPESLAGVVRR